MQTITDYEVVRHGIDSSSYFLGCGVSLTNFEYVVTGSDDDESAAFENALECMAQIHDIPESEYQRVSRAQPPFRFMDVAAVASDIGEDFDAEEHPSYYVSIRYNLA